MLQKQKSDSTLNLLVRRAIKEADLMEVCSEAYRVVYDPTTATVTCQGSLRHRGDAEYQSVLKLFSEVASQAPKTITLQLRQLQFLDGNGVNVLFKQQLMPDMILELA